MVNVTETFKDTLKHYFLEMNVVKFANMLTCPIITARQQRCWKVMFSVADRSSCLPIILFMGEGRQLRGRGRGEGKGLRERKEKGVPM